MWTDFWTFDPLPSWTILLNMAYVVIWTFDNPLPLPCPHGLRLTPYVWWLFTNFFGSDSFKPYINLWKLYYWVPEARTSVKLFCKQNPPLSDLFIILKTFGQNIYTKKNCQSLRVSPKNPFDWTFLKIASVIHSL